MLSANSGRFSPKKSAAAPQAAKVTFMKSGERPIMPQVARAQFSIILVRVSSASRVVGLSKERHSTMNRRQPACPRIVMALPSDRHKETNTLLLSPLARRIIAPQTLIMAGRWRAVAIDLTALFFVFKRGDVPHALSRPVFCF